MIDISQVTLGEGNTPLVSAGRIGRELGFELLRFKLEQCNPTGSYKDRFVAAEVSHLVTAGARGCVATSSGNTGSSLAAYCARAGLRCTVVVPENAPAGKLAQMRAHGARLFRVPRFVHDPDVTRRVLDDLERSDWPLVVSAYRYCPAGMWGVESIGRELRDRAEHVFAPVGSGGLFIAVARGIAGWAKVHAVQPARCATVAAAFASGADSITPVQSTTRISGLAVPFDIDASLALRTLRETGGSAFAVEDEEVFDMQARMLESEGIYCEPAGAAALAGAVHALRRGVVRPHERVVCLVTGHGFKDPASIEQAAERHPEAVVEADQLMNALEAE